MTFTQQSYDPRNPALITYVGFTLDLTQELEDHFTPEQQVIDASVRAYQRYVRNRSLSAILRPMKFETWLTAQNPTMSPARCGQTVPVFFGRLTNLLVQSAATDAERSAAITHHAHEIAMDRQG